ncbi:MAG: VIT1/CCC1 family protein [Candidatus Thermoplasmatota archaeon]|jgi:predicted membrane protein (TIGR00267 family)|nr:VIT1/CCC1 family protein [Candidatus Thermoplasmatota archaeon]
MDEASLIQKCIKYYRDELTDELFYIRLSERISDKWLAENLARLSKIEKKHSSFWKGLLENKGIRTESIKPRKLKVSFMVFLSRIIGTPLTVKLLENGEVESVASYRDFSASYSNRPEIGNIIEGIIKDEVEHESVFSSAIDKSRNLIERNRSVIYGISDGLVEVLATLAGLSAIISVHSIVALGGTVVAVSGMVSMSVGAYLSKNSESQLRISEERKRAILRNEDAQEGKIKKYKNEALSTGLNTGAFYIVGAAIPILPFVFLPNLPALITSIILVAFTQAISNGIVALSVGQPVARESIKSASLALLATLASFLVGQAFHIFLHISVL